jgi:tetratricopeptide (TPR) repeat protein
MASVANGRLDEVEIALSAARASGAGAGDNCVGIVLNNAAARLAASGRLAAAEIMAERSILALEQSGLPDDPVLLRSLQILTSTRFEQAKFAKARESFQRMQSMRIERPEDRALVHSTAAVLLRAAGRNREAEFEYLATVRAWEEAGRGGSVDAGAVLTSLGMLYIKEQRLDDAGRVLDRALAILAGDKDTLPLDHLMLLCVRGVLHARQHEWRQAERDLREAVLLADREPIVGAAYLGPLLASYSTVLRKNHRRQEARAIESRADFVPRDRGVDLVVDVTELLRSGKTAKK